MPLIEYPEDRAPLGSFSALDYRRPEEQELDPDMMTVIGAAFRQDNTVASMASNKMAGVDVQTPDDLTGDEIWNDIRGTRYEQAWDRFARVHNRTGVAALKSQIDMEDEDRRIVESAGWLGTAATFGAAIFDVPSLLPGGAVVRGATAGATIARTAVSTGIAGALAAGTAEIALQQSQQTRPLSESVIGVGAGAIFGGLLGAGAGAVLSKAERAAAMKTIERTMAEQDRVSPTGQSAGAAAVDRPVLGDYDIAAGAKTVGAVQAPLNPLLRAAQSPSAVHRSIMADMAETGFYLERNVRGEGNIAVESAVKYWDRGALSKGLTDTRAIYNEARKTADFNMTAEEFRSEVSKAMRRGDTGVNAAVSKAAQTWRSALFEPLKNAAIEAGLLPADVSVKTAVSYLTRIWNTQRLNAGEARFKQIVRPWIDDQLQQLEFKADEIRLGNKIVDAEKLRENVGKVDDRVQGIEDRLAQRQGIRQRKVQSLEGLRRTRQDVMKERAPRDLVRMLRGADENAAMIDAVKQARAAARSSGKKKPFAARAPVLAMIRSKGGVRIGSKLDSELRALDVTPKTHPGIFRKEGGIGDVDNFVKGEDDIFANLPSDGNGYVEPTSLMQAIRDELAGTPLRSDEEVLAAQALEQIEQVAAEWLDRVGLDGKATVKEVRDFIDRVTGAERNLEGMDSRISRLEREIDEFDAATDKIVNEREISAAEARDVAGRLEALESEIDEVADLANSSPRVGLVVDYAKVRRDLFKGKLQERSLSKRVDALKRLEAEGKTNDDMLAELAAKEMDLGRLRAELGGLKTKADKLEPMVPKVKQELPDFLSPEDRADYVNGIVDDIFRQLTSRANRGMPSYDMVMSSRGPLKERTFNIPDELIEEFLENDIELIARRYARVMSADVELANMDRRMGGKGSPDLQSQIERLTADYQELRDAVHASDMEPKTKEKALLDLAKREASDIEDIEGVRDLLRGQYKVDSQHTNFAKVLRTAGTFNYIRTLGGVLASSLSDVMRPIMTNGLMRYMGEGITPLITDMKSVKMAVEDAKLIGAVTERMTQSRIATMAELADPYAHNSPFERLLDNMSVAFSKMTLLPWWNDMHKSIASVLTQNRVLKNAQMDYANLTPAELKYMGFVGIDEHMAQRIARQFSQYGDIEGNVHIPGIERWDDDGARRAFAAAVNKDVDGTIVTKSVADVPLFANTPAGRAFLQFKTFALASNQRMLMRGLQEGPGSIMTGIIGMSTIGMMTYAFKQLESGRDLSDNPGTWIAEGLDRSGLFATAFEINSVFEKLGGPGFYWAAAHGGQMINPDADRMQRASRFANRDAFGAFLGPSFQLGTDTAQLLGIPARAMSGDFELKESDVNRAFKMAPFATLPYWRWIIEGGFGLDNLDGFRGVKPEVKDLMQ